jgi:predicted PurR-regulated permease PerM
MRQPSRNGFSLLAALLLGTAALWFGRPLLVPLALALLLSFLLAPLVSRVERTGVGRIAAVIVVVLLIGSLLTGLGWIVAREAGEFAEALPEYRQNLRAKAHTLRGPLSQLDGAADSISDLEHEIEAPGGERPAPKVEVVRKPGLLERVSGLLTSVLDPLGTAAVVAVLSLFMLLEREELRDRLIWLTGGRDLNVTTHAIEDAEERLSRYFFTMTLLCGMHGLGVAAGLWWIGIPGAVLWGVLAALLRFLPYFGPWLAAALPTVVSISAFPGWEPAFMTVGLFVALELISNNVLEPWLYGSSVGLSPFGLIFSAVFWTWLWGIPGLILATPITVCLVVMGRYVRDLEFFSVLLGDQPALAAEIRLYQRLLALDLEEAGALLHAAAREQTLLELSDRLVFPVIRRLAFDDERDLVPDAKSAEVRMRLLELLDELLVDYERKPDEDATALEGVHALCVAARSPSDELASHWVERLLQSFSAKTSLASSSVLASEVTVRVAQEGPRLVCVSAVTPDSVPHARLLVTRLRAMPARSMLVLGLWSAPEHEIAHRASPAGSGDGRVEWVASAAGLSALLGDLSAESSEREVPRP